LKTVGHELRRCGGLAVQEHPDDLLDALEWIAVTRC
jgi:hypothetical protein